MQTQLRDKRGGRNAVCRYVVSWAGFNVQKISYFRVVTTTAGNIKVYFSQDNGAETTLLDETVPAAILGNYGGSSSSRLIIEAENTQGGNYVGYINRFYSVY